MPKKASAGRPFLTRRGNGRFGYFRRMNADLAPRVAGPILAAWSKAPIELAGRSIVKISLKTDSLRVAQERWCTVHAAVEASVDLTRIQVRPRPAPSVAAPKPRLTPETIATIAGQVRHDILERDDGAWVEPEKLSPVAHIMGRILQDAGETATPERARDVEQRVLLARAKAALREGRPSAFELDFTIVPNTSSTPLPLTHGVLRGDVSRALEENGLDVGLNTDWLLKSRRGRIGDGRQAIHTIA